MLEQLRAHGREASVEEAAVLRGWRSWGALPHVFEPGNAVGVRLRQLLTRDEMRAAARTTTNAHYTDPRYAAAIWETVAALGFDGGQVLEPGCGRSLSTFLCK